MATVRKMTDKQRLPRILHVTALFSEGPYASKASVFTLQLLGFEVSPICSLMISNGRHYGHVQHAAPLSVKELKKVYQCWKKADINNFDYIFTGFLGESVEKMEAWIEVIKDIKDKNPNAKYVCDPVIADRDERFLTLDVIKCMKERLLPLVDVITPNVEELGYLVNINSEELTRLEAVTAACDALHEKGIETVILKNVPRSPTTAANYLSCVKETKRIIHKIEYDLLPAHFSGCGDVLVASFTGWLEKESGNEKAAFEKATSIVNMMLKDSYDKEAGKWFNIKPGK